MSCVGNHPLLLVANRATYDHRQPPPLKKGEGERRLIVAATPDDGMDRFCDILQHLHRHPNEEWDVAGSAGLLWVASSGPAPASEVATLRLLRLAAACGAGDARRPAAAHARFALSWLLRAPEAAVPHMASDGAVEVLAGAISISTSSWRMDDGTPWAVEEW